MVVAAVAVAVVVATTDSVAVANPIDMFGFGARGPAMGRAQTAATIDMGAHYYNPAVLATFDELRFDLGYQLAQPRLTLNGRDSGVNRSRGLLTGISVPGRIGPVRVAFGGGLFLPDDQVSRTRTLPSGQPRFVVYDNRPQRLFLAANVAVQLTDAIYLGAGVGYMSGTTGGVVLAGRIDTQRATRSELALAIDVDLKTVRYPQAGIFVHALSWLDIGATYRGGFVLDVDLAVRIEGDVGVAGGPFVVEDGFIDVQSRFRDLFQPAQVVVGTQARLTDRLLVAFDLEWQQWSTFDNPASVIDIALDLRDLNDLVHVPEAPRLPAPQFHDILVPHLGAEWIAARRSQVTWRLRGGYVFEPTPTPAQSGAMNFVDSDKHTVSAGVGAELRGLTSIVPRPIDVDLYAAYTTMTDRIVRKISPADRVGDYRAGGSIWQVGLASRWRF